MILCKMVRFLLKLFSILSVLIIVIGLFITAYLLYIPLDLSNYKGYLIKKIESETNVNVSLEKIVLKVLPNPHILLDGFEIKIYGDTIFSSRTVRMNLYLMPLLRREINIKRVAIDYPLLRIKRDKNGSINLSKLFTKNKIKADIEDIRTRNGRVWFIDEFIGDKRFYTMGSVTLHLRSDYGKKIVYEIKGTLHDDTSEPAVIDSSGLIKDYDKEDLLIDGKILANNINLYNYEPYLKSILSDADLNANMNMQAEYSVKGRLKSVETSGRIDYSMLKMDMPKVFSKKIVSTKGSFEVDIKYDATTFSANINNGTFQMPEFTASGKVWWAKSKDKVTDAGFDAKTSPFPMAVIKGYIPSNILPASAEDNLRKLEIKKGTAVIDHIAYSSKRPDDFSLKMVFKEADFLLDGFKKTFAGMDGNFALKKATLAIENMKGKYGASSIEQLSLNINNAAAPSDKGTKQPSQFNLKTNMTLDLKDIGSELKQADFGMAWARTAGELKEISGIVGLALEASGSLQKKGRVSYKGTASIKDVNIIHKNLVFSLKGITGTASFDNNKISLGSLSGKWDKSTFVCSGTISEYNNSPSFNLNIKGSVTEKTLKEVFAELKESSMHFDNNILFASKLKGTADNMSADIDIDTTKSNVQYSTWFTKPSGYPFSMDGVLRIKRPPDKSMRHLIVEKLNAGFGSASVALKGDVYKGKAVFSIETNEMDMDDVDNIVPYFKKEFKSSGAVSLHLNLTYDLKDGKNDINGYVNIKDAQFETGVLPKVVSRANISAKVSNSKVNAVVDAFETGTTKLFGRIDMPDAAKPFFNFSLTAQYLDFGDLYPLQEKRRFIPTGSGSIMIKRGRFSKLDIESFRADILMERDSITLKPMAFTNNNGVVNGSLKYFRDVAPSDKPLFTANFKIDELDAEKTLKDIGTQEKIISGKIDTSFELTAKRGKANVISGLDGRGHAISKDGKMWRFILMSKIFSIVNIISINELLDEGLPYRELKGNFVIKDGIISTEDLTLDSSSMRMSAIGGINMEQRTVDAKLGVHPFVTVDKIVTKIPLAGWIIGGKEKSTLSMYYEVKGDLKNPDVEAVPIKSLGTGILGIFQRVLELPVDIIKPLMK